MTESSESELYESTLTPDQAKASRKAARSKFTRLTTNIDGAIVSAKEVAVLEVQKESLTELYEECIRMHTKCSA